MRRLAAFLVSLLLATPALADMYQDASNSSRPAANRNLGASYTVKPGESIQAALDAAKANGGGTVYVQKGTYQTGASLKLASHTHLQCEPGAVIQATFSPTGGAVVANLGTQTVAINENFAAGSKTDSDLAVTGCGFVGNGNASVRFRQASDVRIIGNSTDGTLAVLMNVDGGVVERNRAVDVPGTCYDSFEAPTRIRFIDNYCKIVNLGPGQQNVGILATGTDINHGTAAKASEIEIVGNTIVGDMVSGAGIWVNGLGLAGSGASNVRIVGNYIDAVTAASCIKVSGAGNGVMVDGNICDNPTNQATIYVGPLGDSGGNPTATLVRGNIVRNANIAAGSIYGGSGTNTQWLGNYASGTYQWMIDLQNTAGVWAAENVSATTPSVAKYLLTGAVNPVVRDAGFAVTVATLPACNATLKHQTMAVSDQSGAPTYRGALTGGGSLAVLAYCNGTSWEAH